MLKRFVAHLKPYLRWVIVGGTVFFLAATLRNHWQDVAAIRIEPQGWIFLALALLITLIAHVWTGWVWGWILQFLGQVVTPFWSIRVYLKTNIAKYLPGNVWHFYGRVWTAKAAGIPLGVSIVSVLLEPLLMAAAALIVALVGVRSDHGGLQAISLGGILIGIHPSVMNPVLARLGRAKRVEGADHQSFHIRSYPLLPLLGELGFLILRSGGFLVVFLAIAPWDWAVAPRLVGTFSVAWLLGLVVPGAPGGIGVFEVTAIALLQDHIAAGVVLSVVAIYRLISVLAEAIGAGIAYLVEPRSSREPE